MTNTITAAFNASPTNADLETDLRRAKWLANWLDGKFNVLGFKFGVESLLGFVPVVGDTLGVAAGLYPLYVANRHKLGKEVQVKMGVNLVLEWLIGLTPGIGDVADTVFKANLRNYRLLEEAARR